MQRALRKARPAHRWGGIFAGALVLSGCASPPTRIFDYASRHGLEHAVVVGAPFRHVVIRNDKPLRDASLRIYLEGDGSPYVNHREVAADPTPRRPLMLYLMTRDPVRAVYVGRPCYLGLAKDAQCSGKYWTSRRYSPEVVDSLAAVIKAEMQTAGATSVQLFGHSGGAALAVLLTQQLQVHDLVTIAGNLDTARWTDWHGYLPLTGSMNPADVTLPAELALRTDHYAGAQDENVPLDMLSTAASGIGGRLHVLAEFTHQCCWLQRSMIYWP